MSEPRAVKEKVLRGLFISPTGTSGIRAIEVVIEAVKAKVTEVNSEAGEEFQAKDVLYPVGVHFRRSH